MSGTAIILLFIVAIWMIMSVIFLMAEDNADEWFDKEVALTVIMGIALVSMFIITKLK